MSGFFSKFADHAHLGKIGTDFAPGIILTVCVLLLLNNFTDMVVFPYANRSQTGEARKRAVQELNEARAAVRKTQGEIYELEAEGENTLDDARKVKLSVARKVLPGLIEARAEKKTEATVAAESAKEAVGLSANIDILGKHFMALFIIGYFAGLVFAQVSGRLFYNGTYHRFFKKRYEDVFKQLYKEDRRSITYLRGLVKDEAFLARLPDLETNFYRYLEIAMNMVLPCGVLAVTLIVVGVDARSILAGVLGTAMVGVTIYIYLNGRVQYVGYSFKKADVAALVRKKLAEEQTTP